ncbi:hypothetical protein Q7P36_003031 [Cladosporium allicinum]
MPLVVPGLTNNSSENDKTNNWMNQLMGKKIGDTSNETLRVKIADSHGQTFAKTELPKEHRVIREGDMSTMDHKPDRLNIHVGADDTVNKVTHG